MSRGELNRKHDDASSSGGGAGAAPRGKGDETKVLGGFAGSKNDGEDLLTGRRCLAAKGFKNDGAEFLGTERIFLAAKGSRNDGAEAEAEEVLGAFAGSKMANTAAAAAAERIDGAGLGALAEKAAAAFFDATPAVPHAVTLTEKVINVLFFFFCTDSKEVTLQRRLPSPSMARASVSSATSHSNAPQSSKRGRTSRCSGYHRSIESKVCFSSVRRSRKWFYPYHLQTGYQTFTDHRQSISFFKENRQYHYCIVLPTGLHSASMKPL